MPLVRDIRDIATLQQTGRYHEVAPAARVAQAPPPFLLGPVTPDILWDLFGETQTPSAGCYTIEGAMVAPTGIAIRDGVALHGQTFIQPRHHVVTVSNRINVSGLAVREVAGPLAVIYGPANETWGHWLADFLPRLWVLHAAGHRLDRLRFLVPPDLKPFARELLALCGIQPEQCVTYAYWQELIRTDCLLMPSGLRAENRFATCFAQATDWWTGLARAELVPGGAPRLFLSRSGSPQARQMANREAIEAMARDAGYAIVHPEALSVREQIALFSGARVMVGEYGSALHNSVFAGAGVFACGLRGTSRHPSLVQSGLATALGQRAAYVFGDTGGQDVAQRFSIEPRLFRKAIELLGL